MLSCIKTPLVAIDVYADDAASDGAAAALSPPSAAAPSLLRLRTPRSLAAPAADMTRASSPPQTPAAPAKRRRSGAGDVKGSLRRELLQRSSLVSRGSGSVLINAASARGDHHHRDSGAASPRSARAAGAGGERAFVRVASAAALVRRAKSQPQLSPAAAARRGGRSSSSSSSSGGGGDREAAEGMDIDGQGVVQQQQQQQQREWQVAGLQEVRALDLDGDGGICGGDTAGDGECSDASSLPEGPPVRAAIRWTASRKRLEEGLDEAAARALAAVGCSAGGGEAGELSAGEASGGGGCGAGGGADAEMAIDDCYYNDYDDCDDDGHDARLAARLAQLNLEVVPAVGDGNCQFRAVSLELYGTQAYHLALRAAAVKHMIARAEHFACYLGEEWGEYVAAMASPQTWGDELTLRALCDALRVRLIVVTSDAANCVLRYEPEGPGGPAVAEAFLAYRSPVHYDAVRRKPSAARRLIASLSRRAAGRPSVVSAA